MTAARALVVAKAPVPGRVKTRLGRAIGMEQAAEVAAAALLDCLSVCAAAFSSCHLALDGSLDGAVRGPEIADLARDWDVFAQEGADLGERLARAHARVGGDGAVVVQVGMDTPQMTRGQLLHAAGAVRSQHDAVLGPAVDGGWWLLALALPAAASVLAEVEMSAAHTGRDTRRALSRAGLRVRATDRLRDVDTVADARLVAAAAPRTRFALAWRDGAWA